MNTGKVLLGLIAGFAAGASLGIILAPAKGSETRKIFSRKSDEASDPLIETFIEFLSSVSGKSDDVDKVANELISKVKSTLRTMDRDKKTMETESGTYRT